MRQACQTSVGNELCNEQARLYQHEVQKTDGSRSITAVCHSIVYAMLHYAVLHYAVYAVLPYAVLHHAVLHYAVLHSTVLHHAVLYSALQYTTALCKAEHNQVAAVRPAEGGRGKFKLLPREFLGHEHDLVIQLKPPLRGVFPPVPPQKPENLGVCPEVSAVSNTTWGSVSHNIAGMCSDMPCIMLLACSS